MTLTFSNNSVVSVIAPERSEGKQSHESQARNLISF
ncbi:hypothetical protein NIES22_73500 (plasmid) [Calothrix brevissima NIES-22]|nr:hypothetical protein NIES22_73500 [Calothrix brevissima NIES-22]